MTNDSSQTSFDQDENYSISSGSRNSNTNYGTSHLGTEEEDLQNTSASTSNTDEKKVRDKNDDTTLQAGDKASNPASDNLAGNRRDAGKAATRANEATDPNDTGSGGIAAGGAKSSSSLQ